MAIMLESVPLLFAAPAALVADTPGTRERPRSDWPLGTTPEADLGRARSALARASERPADSTNPTRTERAPAPHKSAREMDSRHEQLQRSLTKAGKQLLLEQFCREVERLLHEQLSIIPLLSTSPEWTERVLNRHYSAIRAAAQILKLEHLAAIAGRAEVLVSLLEMGRLQYQELHTRVLTETVELLASVVAGIRRDGTDRGCTTASRTAMCLYAAVEPITLEYTLPSPSPKTPAAG